MNPGGKVAQCPLHSYTRSTSPLSRSHCHLGLDGLRLRSVDHSGDRDFNCFLNVRNTSEPEGPLIQDRLVDRLEPVVRVILAIALRDIAANVFGIGPVSSPDALCTQSSAPVSQTMFC